MDTKAKATVGHEASCPVAQENPSAPKAKRPPMTSALSHTRPAFSGGRALGDRLDVALFLKMGAACIGNAVTDGHRLWFVAWFHGGVLVGLILCLQ